MFAVQTRSEQTQEMPSEASRFSFFSRPSGGAFFLRQERFARRF